MTKLRKGPFWALGIMMILIVFSQQASGQDLAEAKIDTRFRTDVIEGASEQEVWGTLTAVNTIFPSASAEYEASQRVVLKPGFHAKQNSYFRASTKAASEAWEEQEGSQAFFTYPNPAQGKIGLSYHFQEDETYHISIYDDRGKVVLDKTIHHVDSSPVELAVDELSQGLFMLQVTAPNGEQKVNRFMIQR